LIVLIDLWTLGEYYLGNRIEKSDAKQIHDKKGEAKWLTESQMLAQHAEHVLVNVQ
jgi:hypothetical protein